MATLIVTLALLLGPTMGGVPAIDAGYRSWDKDDCKGLVRGNDAYCKSGDCKALIRKNDAYCDTGDCKAVIRKNDAYCKTDSCKALLRSNDAYCR